MFESKKQQPNEMEVWPPNFILEILFFPAKLPSVLADGQTAAKRAFWKRVLGPSGIQGSQYCAQNHHRMQRSAGRTLYSGLFLPWEATAPTIWKEATWKAEGSKASDSTPGNAPSPENSHGKYPQDWHSPPFTRFGWPRMVDCEFPFPGSFFGFLQTQTTGRSPRLWVGPWSNYFWLLGLRIVREVFRKQRLPTQRGATMANRICWKKEHFFQ